MVAGITTRPATIEGTTLKQITPQGTAYFTINQVDGEPHEVFLNGVGKAGSDILAFTEAIGRLISYILQNPTEKTPTERLRDIANQLSGIGGAGSTGFGPNRVKSYPDGLSISIKKHLGDEPAGFVPAIVVEEKQDFIVGDICPDCSNATLIFEEGCQHCTSCGYSRC